MSQFDQPMIDCHARVLDPAGFPHGPDNACMLDAVARFRQILKGVALAGRLFPDPAVRKALFRDTSARLFGFGMLAETGVS